MTELRRVGGPPSPLRGTEGRVVTLVVLAIVVAVIKPWGAPGSPGAGQPSALPSATATPEPTATAKPPFDFRAFGPNEPRPRWEIWPAGYFTSFGFAMRIERESPNAAGSQASGDPAASGTPLDVWPGTDASPPAWPEEIHMPAGSRLQALGLNRPLGFDVQVVRLSRLDDDGSTHLARVVLAPSPWPSHFTIIGLGADDGSGSLEPWPPGRYRLDVIIEPGHLERTVRIVVEAPFGSERSEHPTPGPTFDDGPP